MPELPEVETTRRGIELNILHQTVETIIIRQKQLRWTIPAEIAQKLPGQKIEEISRRGKYILLHCKRGTALIHLGMSGSLRILPAYTTANKHDHVDIIFKNMQCLRLTDPRRFGCLLWIENNQTHALLENLGPEPLSPLFSGKYLYQRAYKSKIAIKTFIMNAKIVVGVGNIYANEALFCAKLHPQRPANTISLTECSRLVTEIKKVLRIAIKKGGTTLRNFTASDGRPGYFKQKLKVYGRSNQPCLLCHTTLIEIRLNQRTTVLCPRCQSL